MEQKNRIQIMAKKQVYKGSLTLEWYNKEKSILLAGGKDMKTSKDIPAPKLNWVNKDGALFYEIDETEGKGVKPYWVDRNDIRVKEPRPLVFQKAYTAVPKNPDLTGKPEGYELVESDQDDPAIENILIKGDNLLALNTLVKLFENKPEEEKVKCIYIDPPYNTGQAFEHYDDNLSNSEWLTLTRDRFLLLYKLLKSDGVLFVQLDNEQVNYAKIMLDEIFDKINFVNMICYERSGSAGIGQGGHFVDTSEYILIYAKNKELLEFNPVVDSTPLDYETMKRYNKVLSDEGKRVLIKEFTSKSNGLPVKIYKHDNYEITSISLRGFEKRKTEIISEYVKCFSNVFRTTNPQTENSFQNDLISEMENGLYSVDYTPSRGKNKDHLITTYYNDKGIFAWLRDTAEVEDNQIVKTNKISTVWLHADIPKADLANEGGVDFRRSKKPEQLLKRIIELSTNENDFVFDCFVGSGTTCCVATKMNRKWIGIEIGKHADTHSVLRLKNVLSGEDQSGISKSLNWRGGGSFRYYHLGESIISVDENGRKDFNWNLSVEDIAGGVLYYFDYKGFEDKKLPKGYKIGILEKDGKKLIGLSRIVNPESKDEPIITEFEIGAVIDHI